MKRRDEMPDLVYWGLYGLGSRGSASAFMWGCVVAGVVCVLAVARMPFAVFGLTFFPAAWWYWHSIRWVDQNSSWESQG